MAKLDGTYVEKKKAAAEEVKPTKKAKQQATTASGHTPMQTGESSVTRTHTHTHTHVLTGEMIIYSLQLLQGVVGRGVVGKRDRIRSCLSPISLRRPMR